MAKKQKASRSLSKKASEFKGKVARTQKGKPEYGTQEGVARRRIPQK